MNITVKRALWVLLVVLVTPSVVTAANAPSPTPSAVKTKAEGQNTERGGWIARVFSAENVYFRAAADVGFAGQRVGAVGFDAGLDIRGDYSRWGLQLNLSFQNYGADSERTLAFMMASVNLGFVGGGFGVIGSPRGSAGEGGWFWVGLRQVRVEFFVNAPWGFSERGSEGHGLAGELFDRFRYRIGISSASASAYAHGAYRFEDRLWVTMKMQGGEEAFGILGFEWRP